MTSSKCSLSPFSSTFQKPNPNSIASISDATVLTQILLISPSAWIQWIWWSNALTHSEHVLHRIEETFVENWVPCTPNPIPTSTDKQIFTVVLTGGPCGGKSSCLQYLSKRLREDYSIQVFLAPEIPTMFKNVCECPFPFRGSKQHQMVWEGTKMRMKVRSVDACY